MKYFVSISSIKYDYTTKTYVTLSYMIGTSCVDSDDIAKVHASKNETKICESKLFLKDNCLSE